MVLKVTKPVVVLPLVGVNRAFAEGPSICVAQPDSRTTAQEIISLFIQRPQFKTLSLSHLILIKLGCDSIVTNTLWELNRVRRTYTMMCAKFWVEVLQLPCINTTKPLPCSSCITSVLITWCSDTPSCLDDSAVPPCST